MHVTLTNAHCNSQCCQNGRRTKHKCKLEIGWLNALESSVFKAGNKTPENVKTFLCLGRTVSATLQDWPAVSWNLVQARKHWGQFSTLLQ